jgi:hypothetical protein
MDPLREHALPDSMQRRPHRPVLLLPGATVSAAPADLHELLTALEPHGWRYSGSGPGLYLPPEHGGPRWVKPDGPGRVVMYGSGMLALGASSLLVPMTLDAVVPFLRERGAM